MLRRSLFPLAALLLIAATAQAQVPTLQLGAAGGISLVPPGPITADGNRVSLTLVVSDAGGVLANGVRFKGTATSAGRIDSDCRQVGPGLYDCAYTTPEGGAQMADLRVRAKLESGTELEASFPLEIVSEKKGRLSMNATPDRIVLGNDPTSSLMFTLVDKSGQPIEGANLVARSNVGEVQALTPLTGGNYSAVYVPPTAPFPQVAIVSVWDQDNPNTSGFFTIPLIGKVNYPVDARAPGVTLVFKVGDQTFPPAVTDASGMARVPITVPPGIKYADVELIQATGARSTQKIDLQVPPFNRIAIGGTESFLTADGEEKTRVRIFAVDPRGRPADGQNIVVTATQGEVSPVRFVRDGIYEVVYTTPRVDQSSRATVTAVIAGEEASSTASIDIGLEPGLPAALELTANPAQITPSVTKSTLTATIQSQGVPSETLKVEFRTAEGPVASPKRVSPGVFSADVPVAWNIKKVASAIVGMRGNKRPVEGLVAFPLDDVVLTGQKMPITVVSLDRFGNPVANAPVNVTVTGGGGSVTSSVQTDDRGLGTVLYSAGPLPGLATVRFEVEGVAYQAPVWQAQAPVKSFAFPVSGGQTQGRTVARWRKLRATVSLGADQEATVTTPAGGGTDPWGSTASSTGGETNTVTTDSGSVTPAGQASSIQVSAVPGNVSTDGGSVNLLVRVVDSAGTLVPGEQVILLADNGTVSNKVNNGDGTTTAVLSIPANLGKDSIQVTATRPAGDLAGFTRIAIGAATAAATTTTKPVKKPKEKKEPVDAGDRGKRRTAQLLVGWVGGGYSYDSVPCSNLEGDCGTIADDELLDGYDFLKTRIRAGIPGSFHIKGEVFPVEYVGAAFNYTRMSYTTDFDTSSAADGGYCATHFCDAMNFINVDLQGRLPLLRKVGPLDVLARVGYMAQDVVMFRKVVDETDGVKKPSFDTLTLHGLRAGLGARYTIIPMIRPHLDYNITFGLGATFEGENFSLTGVTNHNLNVGVNVLPFMGLTFDVAYELTTRSLTLSYANEADIAQRGRINEAAHTVRISAGWTF